MAEQVTEGQFRALLADPNLSTGTGEQAFFTFSSEPDLEKPWFCVDRTGETLKKAIFASKTEALAWFEANSGPVLPVEPERPLPPAQTPADAPVTAEPSGNEQSTTASEAKVEEPERPFKDLPDPELTALIRKFESVYHGVARAAQGMGEKLTSLQASFDKQHEDLIADVKRLKTDAATAKEELQFVAREYAYRHPEDKKFDTFVEFKEFTDIEFDQVEMLGWAKVNYPLAIIPAVGEQLDIKQILVVVKSLKDNNRAVPEFVKFKPRTEVQVSSKLPEAAESSAPPASSAVGVTGGVEAGAAATVAPLDPTLLDPSDPNYSPF